MISFEDFKKVEIKIGKVVSAEKVPDTDKLLKIVFDFGSEERQIIAGLALVIEDVDSLIGKEMPVVVNLEPREIMGLESQGMVIAVDDNGKPVLLHPEHEVDPGSVIK